MSYTFNTANKAFKADEIAELASDDQGLRFLKLRSLSRSEYLRDLATSCGVDIAATPARQLLQTLYDSTVLTDSLIDAAINGIYERERSIRRGNEAQLLSELYRLQAFDWGGLHQNSLEKTIVDNYVKQIQAYDDLCDSIENKLYPSMRSYVLCSWYNHWTSIIIEDVFKDHERVLPAVGLIKKVDFFIDGIPFDLKVTYLPEGFIKEKRRDGGLRPELTLLKQFCRAKRIHFTTDLPEARLLEDLWCKVADHPSAEGGRLIRDLKSFRDALIDEVTADSSILIRWLYENQGVRRFDSSNRLFLILVKKSNYFDSWKLKRARDLLVDTIHGALDDFECSDGDKLDFTWEGEVYSTTSKAIIIAHE